MNLKKIKERKTTRTKPTTRTGTESEKWASHGEISVGSRKGGIGGKITGKKGLERSIPSNESQGPTSKIILSSKAFI